MKEELLEIIENEKELNITYHGIKKLLNSSKKKIDKKKLHCAILMIHSKRLLL